MTKHGQRRQLKRIAAPKLYPVPRKKGGKFVIKPSPGPHPADRCIPIGVVLRDILGYARTLREVKKILNSGFVMVDGRKIKDYKFPVGIMDVIHITETDEYFRILPFRRKLFLHEINKEEANLKIVKIVNKRYVKGGNIQLNLFDGRNILFKINSEEERKKILNQYKVGDSLAITVPDQKIIEHLPMDINNYAMVILGRHMGEHGVIKSLHRMFGPRASTAEIAKGEETIITAMDYLYVIGKKNPMITLPTLEEVEKIERRKPTRI